MLAAQHRRQQAALWERETGVLGPAGSEGQQGHIWEAVLWARGTADTEP